MSASVMVTHDMTTADATLSLLGVLANLQSLEMPDAGTVHLVQQQLDKGAA